MADSIELRVSVTSIKRVDPYVKDILATATQVALYKFNISLNEWEKTDKEGALFVYSRNGEPFHSFMIVNRLNRENFIEPIVKNFDYQMQIPFLLYRNSKSKIFGIWFFNREECIRITLLIESLMEAFKEKGDERSHKNHNGLGNNVDIFSMLSKAQEDFNKTPTKQDSMLSTFSSTPRVPDVTSQSVMDFFAKAGTKSTQKPIVSGGSGENVLHRLMSNPAHSVEHIEKQQRSITPQEQYKVEPTTNTDRRSVPISFPSASGAQKKFDNFDVNGLTLPNMSPPKSNIAPSISPLAFVMHNNPPAQEESVEVMGTSPFAQFLENAQKPLLMTPMMFTTPNTTQDKFLNASVLNSSGNKVESFEMLTEKQLAQALIYLLKNNSDFIKQIHQAYVNSILEKVDTSGSNPLV